MKHASLFLGGVVLCVMAAAVGCNRNPEPGPSPAGQQKEDTSVKGMEDSAKENQSESTAGVDRYKVVHDEVYVMLTISKSGEKWGVDGDFYWTKEGASKYKVIDGDRACGFKGANVTYNAERKELEWDANLDKNPLGWAANVHTKGVFEEGGKYLDTVSDGQYKARYAKL